LLPAQFGPLPAGGWGSTGGQGVFSLPTAACGGEERKDGQNPDEEKQTGTHARCAPIL